MIEKNGGVFEAEVDNPWVEGQHGRRYRIDLPTSGLATLRSLSKVGGLRRRSLTLAAALRSLERSRPRRMGR